MEGFLGKILAFFQNILSSLGLGGLFPGLTKAVESIIPSANAKPHSSSEKPAELPKLSPKEQAEKAALDLRARITKDLKENWSVNFEDPKNAAKFENIWKKYVDKITYNTTTLGSIAKGERGNVLSETAGL